jgi:hypothetical protein
MQNIESAQAVGSAPPSMGHRVLRFPHGVANLTVRVDQSMTGVYQGEFSGPAPQVGEGAEQITIDYPRFNPLMWGRTAAAVTINPRVSWAIEIEGGVAHWDGDLTSVGLSGIELRGGGSHLRLRLPRPSGTVPIRISGGVKDLHLLRTSSVPVRIEIAGGASKLALDHQRFGAVGGPIELESDGYSSSADRYRVEIGGGASQVVIRPE